MPRRSTVEKRVTMPVVVRFSDFAGVKSIPDNDPHAGGVALRIIGIKLIDLTRCIINSFYTFC